MSYLNLSRICLTISGILVLASLALIVYPGPNLGVEFTGGTLMELNIPQDKTQQDLSTTIKAYKQNGAALSEASIARTKTGTYFLRLPTLTNDEHTAVMSYLQKSLGTVDELQYTTIGPTVGSSLKVHTLYALLLAGLAITIYLAFAFRKMPHHISGWLFGTTTIIGLLHDIIIKMGIFVILSHVTTFQFDTLFATAMLSTMGFTISDKVVIFDRIRDNLGQANRHEEFVHIIVRSLKQSLTRTLNMGIALLIMLFALFFLGSESIRWFILALIIGTIIALYSSFFVATPLVVFWHNRNKKK